MRREKGVVDVVVRGEEEEGLSEDGGVLRGIIVLFVKQVHLQKEGGAFGGVCMLVLGCLKRGWVRYGDELGLWVSVAYMCI